MNLVVRIQSGGILLSRVTGCVIKTRQFFVKHTDTNDKRHTFNNFQNQQFYIHPGKTNMQSRKLT